MATGKVHSSVHLYIYGFLINLRNIISPLPNSSFDLIMLILTEQVTSQKVEK